MQLPPSDELVLISGLPPIRAKKLRYYQDENFISRVSAAPVLKAGPYEDKPALSPDDWSGQVRDVHPRLLEVAENVTAPADTTDQGSPQKQHAPELGAKAFGSILKSNTDTPDRDTNDDAESASVRRAYAINNAKRHVAPEQEMLPYFGDQP